METSKADTAGQGIYARLAQIQRALKAPKDQHNKFGGFDYRNTESILRAVKPHLGDAAITLNDQIVEVGGRVYVKAEAALSANGDCIVTYAFAREPDSRKGMDAAQVTGSSSSYARKYALCGLLAIDDSAEDPDAHPSRDSDGWDGTKEREILMAMSQCQDVDTLRTYAGTHKREAKRGGWEHELLRLFKQRQTEINAGAAGGDPEPPVADPGGSAPAPPSLEELLAKIDGAKAVKHLQNIVKKYRSTLSESQAVAFDDAASARMDELTNAGVK